MWKLNLAILAGLIAGVILVTVAKGATVTCAPGTNAISFNADFGLKPYLLNIGTPAWAGKQRLASAPTVAACDPVVQQAVDAQQRFYVLLRAFPQNPTRAQWTARFRSLMQAAIAADAAILTAVRGNPVYYRSVSTDKAWLVANQRLPFGSTPQ